MKASDLNVQPVSGWFLNPTHVERLGGLERIIENHPSPIVEEIGQERVLLRMGAFPLLADYDKAAHDYQRLREFLRPILLETPEDRQKFQMEVPGSWRPPGYDANWKKVSFKPTDSRGVPGTSKSNAVP